MRWLPSKPDNVTVQCFQAQSYQQGGWVRLRAVCNPLKMGRIPATICGDRATRVARAWLAMCCSTPKIAQKWLGGLVFWVVGRGPDRYGGAGWCLIG